jgi:hypothetical protein
VTYRLHDGAKLALYVVGALLCLLIVTIPIAIGIFIKAARGRVELVSDAIVVRGLWATRIPLTDVQRLGVRTQHVVRRPIETVQLGLIGMKWGEPPRA